MLSRLAVYLRSMGASVESNRLIESSCRRIYLWVIGRSLPTEPGMSVDLFSVPLSTNCQHPSLVLACSVKIFRCWDFMSATNGAMNPGLLITVYENRLMHIDELTIFYTVQNTKFSKAVDRRSWTPFWLVSRVFSNRLLVTSSMCAGIRAATSRMRSSSHVRDPIEAVSIFASRSSETTKSANTQQDTSCSSLLAVSERYRSWALV